MLQYIVSCRVNSCYASTSFGSSEHFISIQIDRAHLGPPCPRCSAGPCRLVDGTFAQDEHTLINAIKV